MTTLLGSRAVKVACGLVLVMFGVAIVLATVVRGPVAVRVALFLMLSPGFVLCGGILAFKARDRSWRRSIEDLAVTAFALGGVLFVAAIVIYLPWLPDGPSSTAGWPPAVAIAIVGGSFLVLAGLLGLWIGGAISALRRGERGAAILVLAFLAFVAIAAIVRIVAAR